MEWPKVADSIEEEVARPIAPMKRRRSVASDPTEKDLKRTQAAYTVKVSSFARLVAL